MQGATTQNATMQGGAYRFERTARAEAETDALAAALAVCLEPGDVVLLAGDLGAGKTRFVQGVARALGIGTPVCSPTFNILSQYDDGRLPLAHFDVYRLDDEGQLDDIGFWDVLEGAGASFVEWGEKFPDAMPEDRLDVQIRRDGDGSRRFFACGRGDRGMRLAKAWEAREGGLA